jgi:uncharacterized protein
MVSKSEILASLQEHRAELGQRFSVSRIGLFGSYLHGNADEESDIDVLVDLAEPTFDHYMELKFFLEDLFHHPVDLVLAETLKPRLKPLVAQEVVYA